MSRPDPYGAAAGPKREPVVKPGQVWLRARCAGCLDLVSFVGPFCPVCTAVVPSRLT